VSFKTRKLPVANRSRVSIRVTKNDQEQGRGLCCKKNSISSGSILYRFRERRWFLSKIAEFFISLYLTPRGSL